MAEQTTKRFSLFSSGREITVHPTEQHACTENTLKKPQNYLNSGQHTLQIFLVRRIRLLDSILSAQERCSPESSGIIIFSSSQLSLE